MLHINKKDSVRHKTFCCKESQPSSSQEPQLSSSKNEPKPSSSKAPEPSSSKNVDTLASLALNFKDNHNAQEILNRLQIILKKEQGRNGIVELNKHLIVANDGYTYILKDILHAPLTEQECKLTFLCKPENENPQILTIQQIREKFLAGKKLTFTYNFQLGDVLKQAVQSSSFDNLDIPTCMIAPSQLIHPIITPEGHSYSTAVYEWLLRTPSDPKAATGGPLTTMTDPITKQTATKKLYIGDTQTNKSLQSFVLFYYKNQCDSLLKQLKETQNHDEACKLEQEIESIQEIYREARQVIISQKTNLKNFLHRITSGEKKLCTMEEINLLLEHQNHLNGRLNLGHRIMNFQSQLVGGLRGGILWIGIFYFTHDMALRFGYDISDILVYPPSLYLTTVVGNLIGYGIYLHRLWNVNLELARAVPKEAVDLIKNTLAALEIARQQLYSIITSLNQELASIKQSKINEAELKAKAIVVYNPANTNYYSRLLSLFASSTNPTKNDASHTEPKETTVMVKKNA